MLRLARLYIGECVRVATVRTRLVAFFELHRVQRRDGAEHRRHALHLRHEAHVVIPFIFRREGLHAVRHRMLARLHARLPGRVHRVKRLEEAAHPVEVVLALRADLGLHAIMNRREARAAIAGRLDFRIVRRPTAVVEQHDDRIRFSEVLRPVAVRIHHGKGLRIGFIDAPRQISRSCEELMLPAASMRPLRGDEYEPLRARRRVVLACVVENVTRLAESGGGEEGEKEVELHVGAF